MSLLKALVSLRYSLRLSVSLWERRRQWDNCGSESSASSLTVQAPRCGFQVAPWIPCGIMSSQHQAPHPVPPHHWTPIACHCLQVQKLKASEYHLQGVKAGDGDASSFACRPWDGFCYRCQQRGRHRPQKKQREKLEHRFADPPTHPCICSFKVEYSQTGKAGQEQGSCTRGMMLPEPIMVLNGVLD